MVIRKRLYALILSGLCLIALEGNGTERQPWVGNFLEFEWRNSLLYQSYSKIASGSHLCSHSSDDFFITTSLSNSVGEISLELEATAAHTRRQSWGIDQLRATGRYMWMDDLLGDPFSLTIGATFTQSFVSSLKDVSSFHHGRSEAELFLSVGQDESLELTMTWASRWWGVLGMGCAERGSPWIRGDLVYEYRSCLDSEWRFFVNTLWGLGERRLHWHDFHGYSSIGHQSVDLGVRYTYLFEYMGNLSVDYSYRVYAYNFPAHTHQVMLRFLYLFGL